MTTPFASTRRTRLPSRRARVASPPSPKKPLLPPPATSAKSAPAGSSLTHPRLVGDVEQTGSVGEHGGERRRVPGGGRDAPDPAVAAYSGRSLRTRTSRDVVVRPVLARGRQGKDPGRAGTVRGHRPSNTRTHPDEMRRTPCETASGDTRGRPGTARSDGERASRLQSSSSSPPAGAGRATPRRTHPPLPARTRPSPVPRPRFRAPTSPIRLRSPTPRQRRPRRSPAAPPRHRPPPAPRRVGGSPTPPRRDRPRPAEMRVGRSPTRRRPQDRTRRRRPPRHPVTSSPTLRRRRRREGQASRSSSPTRRLHRRRPPVHERRQDARRSSPG